MQTQPQTQATFTMPAKPHRFVASDRVEGTPVRRSEGTKIGTIERLMIDKVSGKVAYAVLVFGGFMGIGVKHLPVSWDRMKYAVALDAYEINLSDEELNRALDNLTDPVQMQALSARLNAHSAELKGRTQAMWNEVFALIEQGRNVRSEKPVAVAAGR